MFCGLKVFLVIVDRGADGGSESRAEGEGRKLRGGAGAVRDRGGDHSLPDGDDSLRGDRRRSFITRDPVHHCTVPPVLHLLHPLISRLSAVQIKTFNTIFGWSDPRR